MSIRVMCPDCRTTLVLPDSKYGSVACCTECRRQFVVGSAARLRAAGVVPASIVEVPVELEAFEERARPAGLVAGRLAALAVLLVLGGATAGWVLVTMRPKPEAMPGPVLDGQARLAPVAPNLPPQILFPPPGFMPRPQPGHLIDPGMIAPLRRPPVIPDWQARADPAKKPIKPSLGAIMIAIPARGDALFPATPSPFLAVGTNKSPGGTRELWNLETLKQVGSLRGNLGLGGRCALSPDGKYLAGNTSLGASPVEIWSFATGQKISSIEDDLELIDFAGPARLLLTKHGVPGPILRVYDAGNGALLHQIEPGRFSFPRAIAISPGYSYFALPERQSISIYDLRNAVIVGQLLLPDHRLGVQQCFGMAFSTDGSELAGLFLIRGRCRLVVWEMTRGVRMGEWTVPLEIVAHNMRSSGQALEYIENKGDWLVNGFAIIDRSTRDWRPLTDFHGLDRRGAVCKVLDKDRLLVISGMPNNRKIQTMQLPPKGPPRPANLE